MQADVDNSSELHMELHLRSSKGKNSVSLVYHKMRIVSDLEWLLALSRFLSHNPVKKFVADVPRYA